jgi:glutathione S-transferase
MDDLIEIARRKERLIARCEAQRGAIAAAFHDLRHPISIVERALAVTRFLRAHPVVVAVVVAGLIVFRRRSVLGVLTRGIAVWRAWRAVAPWLERIGPGLRRAGTPGAR